MAAWKVARCAVVMVAPGRASPYPGAGARPRTHAGQRDERCCSRSTRRPARGDAVRREHGGAVCTVARQTHARLAQAHHVIDGSKARTRTSPGRPHCRSSSHAPPARHQLRARGRLLGDGGCGHAHQGVHRSRVPRGAGAWQAVPPAGAAGAATRQGPGRWQGSGRQGRRQGPPEQQGAGARP
eukprot:scaffold112993_cov36-Phaeocystis_antarctica.AAC.1